MKSKCLYCGNHPTPHVLSYISNTTSAFMPEFIKNLRINEGSAFERFLLTAYVPLQIVLHIAHVYHWQDDPSRALSGRARVVWEEAERRGIPMHQLVLLNMPAEFYCAYVNGAWQYFDSLPIPPSRAAATYQWMDDKMALKRFLLKANIPAAAGDLAWTRKRALEIFARLKKPVIVKPRFGTHGRHSVTNIRTEEECARAYTIASMLCQCVIVEEHLVGSVYRATYVDGKVRGILRGDPPRVVGDGRLSIRELIAAKNATRSPRVGEFRIDEKFTEFMRRQGLTVDSIPKSEEIIDLSEKIGLSYGGFTAEMITTTHPKLLEILTRAGDLLNAPIIGFDFIIDDVKKDPDEQKWGIIEANSRPFIDLHYSPLEGETINVAASVWDLWNPHQE